MSQARDDMSQARDDMGQARDDMGRARDDMGRARDDMGQALYTPTPVIAVLNRKPQDPQRITSTSPSI
jgi:hypothetical protein